MWNVYCANQIAKIPLLKCVERRALCVQRVFITHIIWGLLDSSGVSHFEGHFEMCLGWYSSQDESLGLPCALIRRIKSKGLQYIRALPPCVSGALACLHAGYFVFKHEINILLCLWYNWMVYVWIVSHFSQNMKKSTGKLYSTLFLFCVGFLQGPWYNMPLQIYWQNIWSI